MKTSSALASISDKTASAADIINDIVKNEIMTAKGLDSQDIETIENPVSLNEITVANDKWANISTETLTGLISSQSMFIPIVVFILVMFTSQMIISAISTEKIDKTLETLLSAPVSRLSVLCSKMLAAGIVAIINAGVIWWAFTDTGSMLSGAIENTEIVGSAMTVDDIMKELGLKLGVSGYLW